MWSRIHLCSRGEINAVRGPVCRAGLLSARLPRYAFFTASASRLHPPHPTLCTEPQQLPEKI